MASIRLYTANNGRGNAALDVVAPELQDSGIDRMTIELRDDMNDWGASGCSAGASRFTAPHIMAQVNQYFWGRVPVRVTADYDGLGIGTAEGANKVLRTLEQEGRPTAIGTGHLSHYPVAFGVHRFTPRLWDVAASRWITRGSPNTVLEVNWGWGERGSRSVPLHSWFRGVLEPTPMTRVTAITDNCTLRAVGGSIAADTRHDRDYKCTTQFTNSERHVAFEVADRLIVRDVLATARSKSLKVCLLPQTDLQCAPCSTTDRLIVRITSVPRAHACPTGTVESFE